MTLLRSRLFDLYALLWSLSFAAPALTILVLPRNDARVRRLSRIWAGGVLWGLRRIVGLRHSVRIPDPDAGQPRLLALNHQSLWETIAFAVIEPEICFVAKRSLAKIPLFGWYLKRSPMIFIDRNLRGSNLRRLLTETRAALAAGRPVAIFPEGTRRKIDSRAPLERGVALLYAQLGVPVTPVIHNSGLFMSSELGLKRGGEISVEYLPPLPAGLDTAEFLERLEAALLGGKDRLVAEARNTRKS